MIATANPTERHLRLVTESDDREPRKAIVLDRRARSRAAIPVRQVQNTIFFDHREGSRDARPVTSIRVLIAAGHALVRAAYRAVLECDERIHVVGEAASGEQALMLASVSAPDVVLVDLELPGLEDVGTTAAIISHPAFAGVGVMLIGLGENDERVLSALRAGAIGVLSRDAEPADVIRALQVVAAGQALFPVGAVRRLLAELPRQSHHAPIELDELTDREREVVALVGMGLSNAEIAEQLVISPATAKTHVSRAMIKLHARDRAQLVVFAYESGLVLAGTDASRSSNHVNALA